MKSQDTALGQFLIVILLFAVCIGVAFFVGAGLGGVP